MGGGEAGVQIFGGFAVVAGEVAAAKDFQNFVEQRGGFERGLLVGFFQLHQIALQFDEGGFAQGDLGVLEVGLFLRGRESRMSAAL